MDFDTDATVFGVTAGTFFLDLFLLNLAFDCGFGSQHFGYPPASAFPKTNGDVIGDDYRVYMATAQVRRPWTINESNGIQASPMAGLKVYNWNLKDCDFCESETDIMLELGASVMWRFLGVDAFTSIDGPGFSFRVRVMTGFGSRS